MTNNIVIRILFTGEKETHSIEYFDDYHAALTRFHAIMASDIGKQDTTYNAVFLMNKYGGIEKQEINDMRQRRDRFIIVARYFQTNEKYNNSIQYYQIDNDQPRKSYIVALQRWFNIVAADLQNPDVIANGAFMIDSNTGEILEGRTFENDDE